MTVLAPTIMTALRRAMTSIDRVARFTDPATTALSHTEQFRPPTADGGR